MKELDTPLVSIVMPTYNRESFLKNAVDSINKQTYRNWELIIVDDGSTDNTETEVEKLTRDIIQNCYYFKIPNGGPGAARQYGIDKCNGDFIAFFDSDDIWHEEHLRICTNALLENNLIDWIYTALTRIDFLSNEILNKNSFYSGSQPKPFLNLNTIESGSCKIIDDSKAAYTSITDGIEACFQCSVAKRTVFDKIRIENIRIGEDRLLITEALKKNIIFAYIDKVTLYYNVHADNISDANNSSEIEKRVAKNIELINSYKIYSEKINNLTLFEKFAIRKRISEEYFWTIGYSLYWTNRLNKMAFKYFFLGLISYPLTIKYYKTMLASLLKIIFGRNV